MDSTTLAKPEQTDLATLANEINDHHYQAEEAAGTALDHAYQAGVLLRRAKNQFEHGKWLSWLKENFDGSQRTAQAYMKIAEPYNWEKIQKRRGSALLSIDGASKLLASPKDKKPKPPKVERPTLTKQQIADMCGTTTEDMDKAKAIMDSGNEEINAAVDRGELDLDEALEKINSTERGMMCMLCGSTDDCDCATKYGSPSDVFGSKAAACPNCGSTDWAEDEEGRYCAKCKDPGEAIAEDAGEVEQDEAVGDSHGQDVVDKIDPAIFAMNIADIAITQLERIKKSNPKQRDALLKVRKWIDGVLGGEGAA